MFSGAENAALGGEAQRQIFISTRQSKAATNIHEHRSAISRLKDWPKNILMRGLLAEKL